MLLGVRGLRGGSVGYSRVRAAEGRGRLGWVHCAVLEFGAGLARCRSSDAATAMLTCRLATVKVCYVQEGRGYNAAVLSSQAVAGGTAGAE